MMKPYNRRNKLRINYKNHNPKKGYINWWEDIGSETKKTTRQKAKIEIRKILQSNDTSKRINR